jgi:formate dehydrogenase beta subunit
MKGVIFNSWRKEALPLDFGIEEKRDVRAIVGWDGVAVMDQEIDLLELLRAYVAMVQEESCGRCIPCRVGSKIILDTLSRLCNGEGQAEDLEQVERVAKLARDGSLCELGQSFPIPLLDVLQGARDSLLARIAKKQVAAKNGYHYHKIVTAPCLNACPAYIDIPRYLEKTHEGNFEEALATIREKTILAGTLGRVCVNPCENDCRRNLLDAPLAIRCTKRFVADYENALRRRPAWPEGEKKKDRVAIVGAGPAGLNAAYQLVRKGYQVTIYEALPVAGGMLAVGIPGYRLPRDILQREIDLVKEMGVEIRLNTRIGQDISLAGLRKKYAAVFIACGLHESGAMGVEGKDAGYAGFIPGVKFLRDANLGQPTGMGRKVAVVGGGNVAIDCARVAWRLEAEEVHLIYRRSRAEMPANAVEVEEAEKEGIQYHFLANPTRIITEQGKVTGVECIKMELGEPDASGRRRPAPAPGSEFVMEVDTLIPAIGQVADLGFLNGSGVAMTKRNTIEVDPATLATKAPGIFAGGDAVHGARTVIEAIAAGNRAALSIDQYLQEGQVTVTEEETKQDFLARLGVYDKDEKMGIIGGRIRHEEVCLPVEERCGNFYEVNLGFTNAAVLKETDRCLRCYRVVLVVT